MRLRTATPMGSWRSLKGICDLTAGFQGQKTADDTDAIGARVSEMRLIGDTVGCMVEDADFGDEFVLIYHAEKIVVPKMTESTDIFGVGNRVYWDPTTRLCTPSYDSGYYWIGIVTEAAAAADLTVEIDLKGDRAEAEVAL